MSTDRSRSAAAAAPPQADEDGSSQDASPREASSKEAWYERILHRFHGKTRDTLRHDLEDALAEATPPGEADTFSPLERAMLKNVLGLHRLRVDDVMVPRADIVAAPTDTSLGDLLKLFRTAGHSRLPIYGETLDDPKGMVHIRDFVDHIAACAEAGRPRAHAAEGVPPAPDLPTGEAARRPRRTRPARVPNLGDVDLSAPLSSTRILRPVLFVPPSMPAIDLLIRMQATRTHMALVIDEYGGTDGLISIEDLVEMIVGDIEDEHDVTEGRLVVPVEGEEATFLADARAPLAEVSAATGLDLAAAVGEMAEEIDTLGGLIVMLAGRVPSRGEVIAGPGALEFEVLDADPRRLKRLRIHRRAPRLTTEVPLALAPPQKALPPPAREPTGADAPGG